LLNGKRGEGPERVPALREGKALKGEPQEGFVTETGSRPNSGRGIEGPKREVSASSDVLVS
jgi:hypothetical protein